MKVRSQKGQQGATANVTEIDLGEKIDGAIRAEAAKMAGSAKKSGSSSAGSRFSRFANAYRPGMYGGYRPWYAQRAAMAGDWKLGAALGLSPDLKRVGSGLLTGTIVGAAGNRVVVWGIANLANVRSKLLGEAIGFGVGLLPMIAARNPLTFGLALPGTVHLVGALVEEALSFSGISFLRNPGLAGGVRRPGAQQQMGSQEAAQAARRKLAEVQAKIQAARASAHQFPRVVARPRQTA